MDKIMKIGMAVFSGTGNTAHVAGLLGEELQKLGAARWIPIKALH